MKTAAGRTGGAHGRSQNNTLSRNTVSRISSPERAGSEGRAIQLSAKKPTSSEEGAAVNGTDRMESLGFRPVNELKF